MQTDTDVLRATPEVNFWLHLYCEIYFAPSQRGGRVFHTRHPKPTTITAGLESRPTNWIPQLQTRTHPSYFFTHPLTYIGV